MHLEEIKEGNNTMPSEEDDSDSDVSTCSDSETSPDEGSDIEEVNDSAEEGDADSNEDLVVKAIKAEKRKKRKQPPTIICEDFVMDICFHPEKDLIALASITGDVLLYQYGNDENTLIETYELHLSACRDVEFNPSGELLFSAAKDKSIMITDVSTGKLRNCYEEAHNDSINCLKAFDENKFVTGDDEGTVKLWDMRKKEPLFEIKVSGDYISDMTTTDAHKYLACAAGDGKLTAIDLKGNKIYASSEDYDCEFTCLGLYNSDTKLLVGTSTGKLYLFNWMEFGFHSEKYINQKTSISCMVPITQNIGVVAGEDGFLRAAHLFPHRLLGKVGEHTMPVEKLDINHDGKFIASCSHNNDIKFWNISYFERLEKVIDVNAKMDKKKVLSNNLPSSEFKNASDFYSGLM